MPSSLSPCTCWSTALLHLSEMCLGLSQNFIHLIVESEDSDALLSLCTACHLKPGTGAWTKSKGCQSKTENKSQNQHIHQLFQTVRGLCSEVANPSQKISSALNSSQDSATPGHSKRSNVPSYSELLPSPISMPEFILLPPHSIHLKCRQPRAIVNTEQW